MYQQQQPLTFKALQIVHIALCTGATLFLAVVLFLRSNMPGQQIVESNNDVLNYVALGFGVGMIVLSQILFKTMFARIDLSSPIGKKFPQYTSAFIVRAALVEGATILNVVTVMLSGSYLNLGMAVLLLLVLISMRPQKQRVVEELKIYYPDNLD